MTTTVYVKTMSLAENIRDKSATRPVIFVKHADGQRESCHEVELLGPSRLVYTVSGDHHSIRLVTESGVRTILFE